MRTLIFYVSVILQASLTAQTGTLIDFKAMPLSPATAKAAYEASKTGFFDNHFIYNDCSEAMSNYAIRLSKSTEPYKQAALAKSNATNPAAQNAANDFADLNSPETQAKIAKMTQEEKLKFAMEVQQRMAKNKNIAQINTANKPDPLIALAVKIQTAAQKLAASLNEYQQVPFVGYGACNGLCKESNPACGKIVSACESKVAHDFYNKTISDYAATTKKLLSTFAANKSELEQLLQNFDSESAKYSADQINGSVMGVYLSIAMVADRMKASEKAGALVMIEAKNNSYVQKEH